MLGIFVSNERITRILDDDIELFFINISNNDNNDYKSNYDNDNDDCGYDNNDKSNNHSHNIGR